MIIRNTANWPRSHTPKSPLKRGLTTRKVFPLFERGIQGVCRSTEQNTTIGKNADNH